MSKDDPCRPGICPKVSTKGCPQGQGQRYERPPPLPQLSSTTNEQDVSSCSPQYCPPWLEGQEPPRSSTPENTGYGGGLPSDSRGLLGETLYSALESSGDEYSDSQDCTQDICIVKLAEKTLRESPQQRKPRRIQHHAEEFQSPVVTFVKCSTVGPDETPKTPQSGSYVVCKPPELEEEENEDTPAEVAAAMLHSEERGLMMRAEPARIYNTLFQDPNELMLVTTASPNPMQDVVVPVADEMLPHTASRENLTLSASIVGSETGVPSTSIFTEKIKEMGLYDCLMNSGRFSCGGDDEDEDDIEVRIDSTSYSSVHESVPPEALEVMLDTALPAHFSRVQLRGSVPPAWFPGYFEALPTVPGMTDVTDCPVSVMEEAWESVLHA